MTYAPKSITDVMKVWTTNGGVNLGIVGDTAHAATGTSYHLGKDQLSAGAYSAVLARDRAGLSNAASAMDLGRLDGTLANLQKFSKWLVARTRAGAAETRDIREIIYSPDGVAIKRWDNNAKVLYTGGDGTGQGDNSHRTHTHISFFRDSEYRDKTGLFLPYFTVVIPPTPPEDPMAFAQVEIPANTWLYVNPAMDANAANVQISPGRPMLLLKANAATGAHLIVHDTSFKHYYVHASEVKVTPLYSTPPVVVTPPTEAQCKVFSDAAYASGKAAGIIEGGAVGIVKGTDAEQARIKGVLGLK